jgi:hypothetical protein
MVRISKQEERRSVSRKCPKPPAKKTGAKKDLLAQGFKPHANAIEGSFSSFAFVSKIK